MESVKSIKEEELSLEWPQITASENTELESLQFTDCGKCIENPFLTPKVEPLQIEQCTHSEPESLQIVDARCPDPPGSAHVPAEPSASLEPESSCSVSRPLKLQMQIKEEPEDLVMEPTCVKMEPTHPEPPQEPAPDIRVKEEPSDPVPVLVKDEHPVRTPFPIARMDTVTVNLDEVGPGGASEPNGGMMTDAPPEPDPEFYTFIVPDPPQPPVIQTYQHENLQCYQCFITFCSSKAKERHMKKSHREEYKAQLQQGDTLFTCYMCDRSFPSSQELTHHQAQHSKEDKPFKCPHCQLSFRTFSEVTMHRRQVCREKLFVCRECGETCRSHALLRSHRETHHEHQENHAGEKHLRPHSCPDCPHSFLRAEHLEAHRARAHSRARHACAHCGMSFGREGNLRAHQQTQHPEHSAR
ncbi:zinc finger protein 691 [Amia ocellicauda]|uniref:zinc finger protein 691 n=1 Tax=Amia ocellicauda TaxID=2972642 RepID=UPI0034640D86|nr:ZN576 protein [Amia calva]